MQYDVLKYGYLGLLALLMFFCFKVISDFQKSNKPFGQTFALVSVFVLISLAGGFAGYLWASKELEIATAKESSISIIRAEIKAARDRLEKNTEGLKLAREKALEEANTTFHSDGEKVAAVERAAQISKFIQEQENSYQKELEAINRSFGENSNTQHNISLKGTVPSGPVP